MKKIVTLMLEGIILCGLLVVTSSVQSAPEVITYEDAEDGDILGWDIYDQTPGGATIANVYDEQRKSRVIEFSGAGTKNGYRLRNPDRSHWGNTTHRIIQWKMKYNQKYVVYISCRTTAGHRYLYYTASNKTAGWTAKEGRYVGHGLTSATRDGQWHTITRNLNQDLHDFQPNVDILTVDAFLIRGSGRVDDIKLLREDEASSGIPRVIRFQAQLGDAQEVPLTGTFTLTFRLYATETGGEPLWEEVLPDIQVEDGLLEVSLGKQTPLDLPFEQPYWLGVEVEADGEMTPRFELTTVPYAFSSGK